MDAKIRIVIINKGRIKVSENNFGTEIISDKERIYREHHREEPDSSRNPYLLSPIKNTVYGNEEENISNEERIYRASHKNKSDNLKNPYLLSPRQINPDADEYISGAEKRFRDTHQDEFQSRREKPYIIPRGKTPEEMAREAGTAIEKGYISSAELRYRARHNSRHNISLEKGENFHNEHIHISDSGTKHRSIRRKWYKIKHKVKHKIKHAVGRQRRKYMNLPTPVQIVFRFAKFFLLCAGLSALSNVLISRGFIPEEESDLLTNLSAMFGIYIVINLFLFSKRLRYTRSRTKYYMTNYIAYAIFAIINLFMCMFSPAEVYTGLFSITTFLFYSHLDISIFLSACAFHVIMFFVIAVVTRIRVRIKVKQ